jgi:hypothetical protein
MRSLLVVVALLIGCNACGPLATGGLTTYEVGWPCEHTGRVVCSDETLLVCRCQVLGCRWEESETRRCYVARADAGAT